MVKVTEERNKNSMKIDQLATKEELWLLMTSICPRFLNLISGKNSQKCANEVLAKAKKITDQVIN